MAEAVVDMSTRYFCHKCAQEISPQLPDFVCPRCKLGFIEELSGDHGSLNPSNDDLLMSDDSDADRSSTGSYQISDILENLQGQFPFSRPSDASSRARRVTEWNVNPESTSTSEDGEGVEEPSSSSSGSTFRGRARRGNQSRLVHFRFPNDPNDDAQQAFEGIFQQILSNVAGGQLAASGRDRAPGGVGRGGFINIDLPIPLFQVLHGNPGDYAWGSGGLDAIITHLLSQLDGTGPPPMPKEDIEKLPTVKITQEQADKNLQCTVCMEDFRLEELVRKLSCTHVYHSDCIVPWLEMHGTCPICRKLLNPESPNRHQADFRSNSTSESNPQTSSTTTNSGNTNPTNSSSSNNNSSGSSSSSTGNSSGSATRNNISSRSAYYDFPEYD